MKTFVMLLTLSLLAIAPGVGAANSVVQPRIETQPGLARTEGLSRSAAPVSFTGTWKTLAGGTNQYTVILEQIGNAVTGSYSPGNGKIFDGVVTDNKLTFKWTQDGGFEGTAEFIMAEDGKGFTGTSNALKPKEFTVTWNTYIPPVTSFAGTWETITNGQHHFVLTMVQTGTQVTGVYPRANGTIVGTVSGRVLRFTWKSDGGSGSGRLVMDETEKAFSGTYNKGDNPDDVEHTWNGKLPPAAGDKAQGAGDKAPGAGDKEPVAADKGPGAGEKASEKVTLADFSGAWQANFGGTFTTIVLRQAGDQVTGQLNANSAEFGVITDGNVVGNTLSFKIMRPAKMPNGLYRSYRYAGNGEVVMDEGGKSFTGKVLGTATSGTFLAK